MRMRTLFFLIAAVSWLLPTSLWAQPTQFFLKNGDTVVFYGDSITAQDLYTQWIELYTVTRFPCMRVRFFNAGVGGDRVSGGGGGPVDVRLPRDVFSNHPSVITIMLGMNDGGYHPNDSGTESTYVKGYEHILNSFHEMAPNARVVVLGPSPFDDITRAPNFAGGYNGVMQHYADLDQNLAREHGDEFVNLNSPMQTFIQRAQTVDPEYARFILPDRVHPEPIGHWAMAEAILKAWNAPSGVSSVSIDAPTAHVNQSLNASVANLEADGTTLRWSETEDALPLPFDAHNEFQQRILQLTGVQEQLNQESLRITGLSAGSFNLAIDGEAVGVFSADDLANGVNLADYHTPMRDQAQRVSWSISDRVKVDQVHMVMMMDKSATGPVTEKGDVLEAYENTLEDKIYADAAPKPHSFALTPVTSNQTPEPASK
ncbi:MAG: SGNH/GDSL hydrolase family protein [Terracidiphilus sp.]|jgi:lysophospholipase L1-like esterase